MKKKFARMTALALCLLLALTSCGSKTTQSSNEKGPAVDSDTVLVGVNAEPTSLHAGFATSQISTFVSHQLFDTLIVKKDGEYLPSLATEWVWGEDNMSMTFTIRDDVYFHDGSKLTVEDVAFSYNEVVASSYSEAIAGFIDHAEVVDDTHVVVYFKYIYGAAMDSFCEANLGIFPKDVYEADPSGFLRNPVGSGPYKFVEWSTGASITMEANEDYWGQKANIKNLQFVIYNNNATSAALALENGEVDIITTVSASDYERLVANDNLEVYTTPGGTVAFIQFSMEEGSPFADENLRLAIAHAINKEDVLLGAAEGYGVVANAIVPEYSFGLADSDYEAPGYDPELAKEYLAAAGYPDGLTISIIANSLDSYYKPAEIVQNQLSDVGINLEMEKMESNAWFEDVWRSGTYGMTVLAFTTSVADVLIYRNMFVTDGSENFGNVSCPDLDEAYDRALNIVDLDERAIACEDVMKAFGDHAICIPLYELDNQIAANKNLQGVYPDPTGDYLISAWSWAE